ncbi:hypothetical protein B0H15DRAFT_804742 [Mycena belliarum]|uniref:Uncharacterized protein n=1 Tax=Mycena belliarum TaxID=1033014 RepID=A0AAD6XJC9_9AGAR|nr:hypothetical protein B0H15DRAFT_804742 [Mycena belliae]
MDSEDEMWDAAGHIDYMDVAQSAALAPTTELNPPSQHLMDKDSQISEAMDANVCPEEHVFKFEGQDLEERWSPPQGSFTPTKRRPSGNDEPEKKFGKLAHTPTASSTIFRDPLTPYVPMATDNLKEVHPGGRSSDSATQYNEKMGPLAQTIALPIAVPQEALTYGGRTYSERLQDYEQRSPLKMTQEQKLATMAAETNNIVLHGRPLSGKTLVAEAISASHGGRVLFVVSSRLQREATRQHLRLHACRVDVHTRGSLAVLLYPKTGAWNVGVLGRLLNKRYQPILPEPYNLIVVDTAQDITMYLFQLILFVVELSKKKCGSAPGLVFCCDRTQSILSDSDIRFSDWAPELFTGRSTRPWQEMRLETSVGLSHETAAELNRFFHGHPPLCGAFNGPEPQSFTSSDIPLLACEIRRRIEEQTIHQPDVRPSCIILAPYLHGLSDRHPITKLANLLTECRISLTHPTGAHTPVNPTSTYNKTLLASYSKAQGLSYSLSVVFLTPDWRQRQRRPGAMQVAMTRGQQLIIVELPKPRVETHTLLAVSSVARELSEIVVGRILRGSKELSVKETQQRLPDTQHILAPDCITSDRSTGRCEDVSDVNGSMVHIAFKLFREEPQTPLSVVALARAAIDAQAEYSGFHQRRAALADHRCDWMEGQLQKSVARLDAEFPSDVVLTFEARLGDYEFQLGGRYFVLRARADIIAQSRPGLTNIYEVKFVSLITDYDKVQAILYGLCWAREKKDEYLPCIILLNIRDGQKFEISGSVEGAHRLLTEIVRARDGLFEMQSNEQFREACRGTIREVNMTLDA